MHLIYDAEGRRRHRLLCLPEDEGSGLMQRWFDELVVRIDELRAAPSAAELLLDESDRIDGGGGAALGFDDEDGARWHSLPEGPAARCLFVAVLPLKALLHLTIPAPRRGRGGAPSCCYPLTLALAICWLALLSFSMTVTLEKVGCALDIASTAMGLTLGAAGLSFPNLYACWLTAKAGQASVAICQALASNTFNVCIGLGLVWLFETLVGDCTFGALGTSRATACHGCYMPAGFGGGCPHLLGHRPPRAPASLVATALFAILCLVLLLLALLSLARCRSLPPAAPTGLLLLVYVLYALYVLGSNFEWRPLCLTDEICL